MLTHIKPNWPAPSNISAFTTTKHGGVSLNPYQSNNLALHVQDNPLHVENNRAFLIKQFHLPQSPEWLNQTHSNRCIIVDETTSRNADAAISRTPKQVLAILTADCLALLITNKTGTEIAAIHAGRKGLLDGIIEQTISKMHSKLSDLLVWIGPAICQNCYKIDTILRDAFIQKYPFSENTFQASQEKWLFNLSYLAELILNKLGIEAIYQSAICTYEHNDFYSYRRATQTGRIASLIWFS